MPKIAAHCVKCGREFYLWAYRLRNGEGRFCSIRCAVRQRDLAKTGYRREGKTTEHVAIVERAIGKPLPKGARVHHVNAIRSDNRHTNLVVCENEAYHKLLHLRQRIVSLGGDPEKDNYCSMCKTLHPRTAFGYNRFRSDGLKSSCKESGLAYSREYLRQKRKEKHDGH